MFEVDQEKQEISRVFSSSDIPVHVVIGANGDKFIPNINASKWKDECWLNVNYPVDIANERLFVDGDVIKQRVGDLEFLYWHAGDKVLEQGFRFYARPSSSLVLNIKDSGNLSYEYQPALTEQDKFDSFRPDNVIDSYAIYKTGWANNQYKDGKFGHLYRWLMIDAEGKWAWTKKQTITKTDRYNGQLTIEFDEEFLRSAIYPLTIMGGGDTWGWTTVGGTEFDLPGDGNTVVCRITGTAPATGTFTKVGAWVTGASADYFKLVLYDDDAGQPSSLVDYGDAALENTLEPVEYEQDITGAMISGALYYAGLICDDDIPRLTYDTVASHLLDRTGDDDWPTPPATWDGVWERTDRRGAVWVEYTTAGGGGNPWYAYAQQ